MPIQSCITVEDIFQVLPAFGVISLTFCNSCLFGFLASGEKPSYAGYIRMFGRLQDHQTVFDFLWCEKASLRVDRHYVLRVASGHWQPAARNEQCKRARHQHCSRNIARLETGSPARKRFARIRVPFPAPTLSSQQFTIHMQSHRRSIINRMPISRIFQRG